MNEKIKNSDIKKQNEGINEVKDGLKVKERISKFISSNYISIKIDNLHDANKNIMLKEFNNQDKIKDLFGQ